MTDFRRHHTGWSDWLKANPRVLHRVESEIHRRGPLSAAAFAPPAPKGKGKGWWDWKPAHHALHYLWLSGRLAIHSRQHFRKSYDLATRILPRVKPIERPVFPQWHLRKTLRALGAATEADLVRYLTFPKFDPAVRRRALAAMLKSGEATEIVVADHPGRWFILAEDMSALESSALARGTTLLCPFDSLLWHRGRAKALFGFDYKIEVYTPSAKRIYGYYTLPILHQGRLIGRLDPKNHRTERRFEVRAVHFNAKPDVETLMGTTRAIRSLALFLGAEEISISRGPLREAMNTV